MEGLTASFLGTYALYKFVWIPNEVRKKQLLSFDLNDVLEEYIQTSFTEITEETTDFSDPEAYLDYATIRDHPNLKRIACRGLIGYLAEINHVECLALMECPNSSTLSCFKNIRALYIVGECDYEYHPEGLEELCLEHPIVLLDIGDVPTFLTPCELFERDPEFLLKLMESTTITNIRVTNNHEMSLMVGLAFKDLLIRNKKRKTEGSELFRKTEEEDDQKEGERLAITFGSLLLKLIPDHAINNANTVVYEEPDYNVIYEE
jgi:hypothetical protein